MKRHPNRNAARTSDAMGQIQNTHGYNQDREVTPIRS